MADQNFRVKRGLEVGIGGTVITTLSGGNVGLGSTNPTTTLDIIGNIKVSDVSTLGTVQVSSGVVTATSGVVTYYGDGSKLTGIQATSIVGVTSYSTSAGIATNIKGGLTGNIPYQSATDTTVFLANGSSGTILQSNGVGNAPSWVAAAPASAITGLTVRDEGTIVGGANSVSQLNFVGNIVSVASTAGIATVTFLDYVANAGVATYATTAGVSTSVIGGIASVSQLNVSGITTVGFITANNLYVAGVGTFLSSGLQIRNPANTFGYSITGGAIIADRVLNLPVITTTDTVATLGLTQTFAGNITFTGTLSASQSLSLSGSAAGTHVFGTNQTTGTLTFGGTSGTGTITLGQATTSQTTNIQAGASGVGTTKTINFGTGGLSGSFTQINIGPGPSAGVGTVTINSGTNLGIGSATPTSALTVVGDASVSGLTTTNNLYVSGVGTFLSSGLQIRNPANTFGYTITGGAIVADRVLNLPVITGTDTVATLGLNQTFTGNNSFNGTLSGSAIISLTGSTTGSHVFGTSQTSGTLTFGGTSGTGLITFGRSTATQQTDIQAGASGVGTTKTINFGTGGLSGSFTQINIGPGPSAGVGTVVINSGTNLGIGSTTPTSKLDVVGDAKFTGVVTATTFSGNATSATYATSSGIATYATTAGIATYATSSGIATYASTSGLSTSVIGGIGSITQLSVSGISTFNNNVYIPSSSIGIGTTNPLQTLQVGTANTLGINTTGTVFVITSNADVGIGTTNPIVKLDVRGNVNITGVVTATTFYGSLTGTATTATNVIGGIASVTQLSVSGVSTFNNNVYIPSSSVGIGTTNPLQRLQIGTANTLGVNTTGTVFVVTSNADVGIGTTNPIVKLDVRGNVNISGVVTASSFSGNASSSTYATSSGIATYATSSGIATYATSSGIATYSTTSGVSTSVIGGIASITQLSVSGVSTFSNNIIQTSGSVGIGTTNPLQTLQVGTANTLGINTTGTVFVITSNADVGIGTTNPIVKLDVRGNVNITGVVTASSFSGNASSSTYATSSGIATYATTAGIATYATSAGIATYATTSGVSTSVIGGIASVTQLSVSGVSTFSNNIIQISGSVGIGTTNPLQTLQVGTANTLGINTTGTVFVVTSNADVGIGTTNPTTKLDVRGNVNISGVSTFSGIATHTTSLFGTQASFTGVVTASSFSGSGANLTSLNASQLTSGTVPSARITASSGDFTVGQNLFVTGNLSVGGTSVILNAATLTINDRDIVVGYTTDINNNDVSNDNTANHGGISVASTVGSPIINIPLQAGINSNPSTYKQFMWIKQGNYSGMGTDAWVSNYAISIGNTSTVQNGSRLTVGTGFTVYDSYLDATDIRARNINATGIITASSLVKSGGTSSQFLKADGSVDSNTYLTTESDTLNTVTNRGNSTSNGISVGVLTATSGNFSGIITSSGLNVSGVSTFNNNVYIPSSSVGIGTTNPLQTLQVGTSNTLGVNTTGTVFVVTSNADVGIGTTNPIVKLDVRGNVNISGVTTFGGNLMPSSSSVNLGNSVTRFGVGYWSDGSHYYGSNKLFVSSVTGFGLEAYASNAAYLKSNTGGGSSGNVYIDTIVGGKVIANGSGSVQILHSQNIKFETLGVGVTITGTTFTNQLNVSGISTFSNGPVLIGTATSTGTTSQPLQVTGGAYVSSNVGVAVTSPSFAVDVSGDARVQSTGKMRFGGTSGTTNFYIQYNSTANSLDFVAG